eukprot:4574658-Amphidinium_carterae.1
MDTLGFEPRLLLGAAHKTLGHREEMRKLYKVAFALSSWETSSISVEEVSTARARGIFTTRRCVHLRMLGKRSLGRAMS